jgi:mono/diheme cytochrome c family protein
MRRRTLALLGILACTGAAAAVAVRGQQGNSRQETGQVQTGPGQVQANDDLQPPALPPLPPGMTLDNIVEGDRIFHGPGGCFACHGTEAQGLPAAGDGITVGLAFVPYRWASIDSLITAGIPDEDTRSPIAMPARGAKWDLSEEQIRNVAAYVWAISQARGEPWPGGHTSHVSMVPPGSTAGTAPTLEEPR